MSSHLQIAALKRRAKKAANQNDCLTQSVSNEAGEVDDRFATIETNITNIESEIVTLDGASAHILGEINAASGASYASITNFSEVITSLGGNARNMIINSDFTVGADGLDYYTFGGGTGAEYSWGLTSLASIYSGSVDSARPLFIRRAPNAADQFALVMAGRVPEPDFVVSDTFLVDDTTWIEFSVNVGASNAGARLWLQFRDDNNLVIGNIYSLFANTYVPNAPDQNDRLWVHAQVPVGATRVLPLMELRSSTNPAAEAFAVFYNPMLCSSTAGATEPQPYNNNAAATTLQINELVSKITGGATETIASINGQLYTRADVEGFAEAHILQEINAASGTNFATVTAFAQAEADLRGNAEASYVLKADAGGGSPAFFRLSDGATLDSVVTLSGSQVFIMGDAVTLNASTTVDGTFRVNGSTHLDDLSVNSIKIGNSAVIEDKLAIGSTCAHYVANNTTGYNAGFFQNYIHASVTVAEQAVIIVAWKSWIDQLSGSNNADGEPIIGYEIGTIELLVGGAVVESLTVEYNDTEEFRTDWRTVVTTCSAGAQVQLRYTEFTSALDFQIRESRISVAAIKRSL